MAKKRILFIADGVSSTGFSTVSHNIIQNLSTKDYEIHHLAVNYTGDPHDFDWKIYPASAMGSDAMGFRRLPQFANVSFDGIFILNDVWVISKYLEIIKQTFQKIPPIIVYFPVDSKYLSNGWFQNFDIVTKAVAYTQFGYDEIKRVYDGDNITIIPHGVDTSVFKRLSTDRNKIRRTVFPESNIEDAFLVLNANRNQPRKRIDMTMKGFSLFAQGKPSNVKLYLHMGLKDVGWDVLALADRYEISDRLVLSNLSKNIQQVPVEMLNAVYNVCNVGINTSLGEGWGLCSVEHAVTGAPQLVPNHSSCRELFSDCGLLIPVSQEIVGTDNQTESGLVHPVDVANSLEKIYSNYNLYQELADKGMEKFTSETYSWKYIVKNQWLPLFQEIF